MSATNIDNLTLLSYLKSKKCDKKFSPHSSPLQLGSPLYYCILPKYDIDCYTR